MKNRKNYVMTKSNLTLTQSGLLAVLLQRQRHKVIELTQRRPDGSQVRALGSAWNWIADTCSSTIQPQQKTKI